jgi:hypothetical protein
MSKTKLTLDGPKDAQGLLRFSLVDQRCNIARYVGEMQIGR